MPLQPSLSYTPRRYAPHLVALCTLHARVCVKARVYAMRVIQIKQITHVPRVFVAVNGAWFFFCGMQSNCGYGSSFVGISMAAGHGLLAGCLVVMRMQASCWYYSYLALRRHACTLGHTHQHLSRARSIRVLTPCKRSPRGVCIRDLVEASRSDASVCRHGQCLRHSAYPGKCRLSDWDI